MSNVVIRGIYPLLEPTQFTKMMRLVRQGNQEAAARLVNHCEPKIHKSIRKLLVHHGLRREIDPHDVSQVVLAKFFVRNMASRCELDQPDQLIRLLVRMARNTVRDEVRKQFARRRDRRRVQAGETESIFESLITRDSTPSGIAICKELLPEIYRRLSEAERLLAHQRSQGLDWSAIAHRHGESPEALRKKLSRAILRVRQQLSL